MTTGVRRQSSGGSFRFRFRFHVSLLLVVVVLCSRYQVARAVTCESFVTEAECNQTTTSSGQCGWKEGTCTAVEQLGEGLTGITSLPGNNNVPPQNTNAGNKEEGASQQAQERSQGQEGEWEGQDNSAAGARMVFGTLVGAALLLQLCI